MIIIEDLSWSNWLSYGSDNYINFDQPVLQIMGSNGSGKTSIPIILQEVYYGKNCKGKKKSSLPNRYIDNPILSAESNFRDDAGNKYKINLIRKASLKLKLFKNGTDISSHTTTATYKTIAEIIGYDFKTFSQIVYQSSTDNLDFLTATDTNRKKFLIGLFNLNKYLDIQNQFKLAAADINSDLVAIRSKISTTEAWITKHENMDLTPKLVEALPDLDKDIIDDLALLTSDLANITSINKRINTNNTWKDLLAGLDTSVLYESYTVDKVEKNKISELGKQLSADKTANSTKVMLNTKSVAKITKLGSKCPSCEQNISVALKESMTNAAAIENSNLIEQNEGIERDLVDLRQKLADIAEVEKKLVNKDKISEEVARLTTLIDEELAEICLDENNLKLDIKELNDSILDVQTRIKKISASNVIASAHNSKINVIAEQLQEHSLAIADYLKDSEEISDTVHKLSIIKAAFGPNGLLSYKIDYLVKDLETEINTYLGELSNGEFQLIFKLENDKLNIEIIDGSKSVGIEELSAGELARINAATLLAIRKLMSAISSTKLNILFLDEILGVLDEVGKETLISVLHSEKDLNTLLVSHEYSHPLIPKIQITKENKISSIEHE